MIGDFCKSIREEGWRYVWYANGEEELYDMLTDPEERKNLARDPALAAEKARLKNRLLEWNALSEDPLDVHGLRELQKRYDRWQPLTVQKGRTGGQSWIQQREKLPPKA